MVAIQLTINRDKRVKHHNCLHQLPEMYRTVNIVRMPSSGGISTVHHQKNNETKIWQRTKTRKKGKTTPQGKMHTNNTGTVRYNRSNEAVLWIVTSNKKHLPGRKARKEHLYPHAEAHLGDPALASTSPVDHPFPPPPETRGAKHRQKHGWRQGRTFVRECTRVPWSRSPAWSTSPADR